jgi:hypothetical protein
VKKKQSYGREAEFFFEIRATVTLCHGRLMFAEIA